MSLGLGLKLDDRVSPEEWSWLNFCNNYLPIWLFLFLSESLVAKVLPIPLLPHTSPASISLPTDIETDLDRLDIRKGYSLMEMGRIIKTLANIIGVLKMLCYSYLNRLISTLSLL